MEAVGGPEGGTGREAERGAVRGAVRGWGGFWALGLVKSKFYNFTSVINHCANYKNSGRLIDTNVLKLQIKLNTLNII